MCACANTHVVRPRSSRALLLSVMLICVRVLYTQSTTARSLCVCAGGWHEHERVNSIPTSSSLLLLRLGLLAVAADAAMFVGLSYALACVCQISRNSVTDKRAVALLVGGVCVQT